MVNYQLGKIYKIVSNTDSDKCYVGSTTKQYLSQRFMQHKSNYKAYNDNRYHRITSFELFDEYGIENCVIVLLEDFACDSKDQLHSRERYYIEALNCVNKTIPGRKIKEYYKKYYEENKATILEKQKEYQNINKDKTKEYYKQYFELNKEKINNKQKQRLL